METWRHTCKNEFWVPHYGFSQSLVLDCLVIIADVAHLYLLFRYFRGKKNSFQNYKKAFELQNARIGGQK